MTNNNTANLDFSPDPRELEVVLVQCPPRALQVLLAQLPGLALVAGQGQQGLAVAVVVLAQTEVHAEKERSLQAGIGLWTPNDGLGCQKS